MEEDSKERNKEEAKTRVTGKETLDDEDYNDNTKWSRKEKIKTNKGQVLCKGTAGLCGPFMQQINFTGRRHSSQFVEGF